MEEEKDSFTRRVENDDDNDDENDGDVYDSGFLSSFLNCSNNSSFAPALIKSLYECPSVTNATTTTSSLQNDNSSSSVFVTANSCKGCTTPIRESNNDRSTTSTTNKQQHSSWIVTASKHKNCCHILSFPVQQREPQDEKINNDDDNGNDDAKQNHHTENQQSCSDDAVLPQSQAQPRHGFICFDREVEAVALTKRRRRQPKQKQQRQHDQHKQHATTANGNNILKEEEDLILLVCTRDGTLWCSAPKQESSSTGEGTSSSSSLPRLSSSLKPSLLGLDHSLHAQKDNYMFPCIPAQRRTGAPVSHENSISSTLFLGTTLLSICPCPSSSFSSNSNNKNEDDLLVVLGGNCLGPPQVVYIQRSSHQKKQEDEKGKEDHDENYQQQSSSIPIEIADICGLEHVNTSCTSIHCISQNENDDNAHPNHTYEILYNFIYGNSKSPSSSSSLAITTTRTTIPHRHENDSGDHADNDNNSNMIALLGFADGSVFACHVTVMMMMSSFNKQTSEHKEETTTIPKTKRHTVQVTSAILLGSIGSRQSVVSILSVPVAMNNNMVIHKNNHDNSDKQTHAHNAIICVGSLGGLFVVVKSDNSDNNKNNNIEATFYDDNDRSSTGRGNSHSRTMLCQLKPGLPSGGPWLSSAPLSLDDCFHYYSSSSSQIDSQNNDFVGMQKTLFRNNQSGGNKNDFLQYQSGIVAVRGDGSSYAVLISSQILHNKMMTISGNTTKYHHDDNNFGGNMDTISIKLPVRQEMTLVKAIQPSRCDIDSSMTTTAEGAIFLSFHTFTGSSLLMKIDQDCWNNILMSFFGNHDHINREEGTSQAYSILTRVEHEYEQNYLSKEDRDTKASRMRVGKMLQCLQKKNDERMKSETNVDPLQRTIHKESQNLPLLDIEKALKETSDVRDIVFDALSKTGPNSSPCIEVILEGTDSSGLENASHGSPPTSGGDLASIEKVTITSKPPFHVQKNNTAQCCLHVDVKPKEEVTSSDNKDDNAVSFRCAGTDTKKSVFYGGTAMSLNQYSFGESNTQSDSISLSFLNDSSSKSFSAFLSLSTRYGASIKSNRKREQRGHGIDLLPQSSVAWFEDSNNLNGGTQDDLSIVLPLEGRVSIKKSKNK